MPSYQYEQLNPESFQQLSQSLIVKEYPGVQCFPVGQSDGGRDATVQISQTSPDTKEFNLFQVKFSRRVLNPSDARKWLLRTLREELPNVRKQIGNGAKKFILVTNVAGTGRPNTGLIDDLQSLLEEQIPIEVQAWWRDDLDRRLDDAWDLKFAYPALLTGTDLFRLMIEASPSEGRERRRNAITAFLTTQFASDREVKFKQVELQADIFDLFTDVPMVPQNPVRKQQQATNRLVAAFSRSATSPSGEVDPRMVSHWFETVSRGGSRIGSYFRGDEFWLGAASLLLDVDFQTAEPLVILEGAPGQGKSTISQFICQIHRMRILKRPQENAADYASLASSLRLPFKVELRDFATWLSGRNPFVTGSDGNTSDDAQRSLEGFLAALVRYESGGSDFNVSDLQSTLSLSAVLLVLDGLDEVAEIKQRQRVVEEITAAVARMKSLAASLQVVVTSRPTPFINSTVLPSETFATYSLGSLTKPLITEYADRWLKSRTVDAAEAKDVRQILDTKLDEPHLRDLARNPMQLAILLSLIHRRGVSLPDKRTALYDSYVEMFFDRESEKAAVVKENRDLLIRIHRYLAWELHAGAETDSESPPGLQRSGTIGSGVIAETDLKMLLRRFLEHERSDPALADELFSGMVERVVAIVSRVQGTYEFDVQTLREYFAARHLYETAPYSPPGGERAGTRSDRWRALTRNFYWLNVARFYAGCYSEGELASLVDELDVLNDDAVFRSTSHPQLLIATLLRDWVFSQRPRIVEDAVDLLLEHRGLRMLVAGVGSGLRDVEDVIVRDLSGRRRLVSVCKDFVQSNRPFEQIIEIIGSVLRPNAEPEELFEWWIDELRSIDESQASRWSAIGGLLGCWSIVDVDTAKHLLGRDHVLARGVISGLLDDNRTDVLESDEELFEAAVDAVLDGERIVWWRGGSILQRLASSIELSLLSRHHLRHAGPRRVSLLEQWNEIHGHEKGLILPGYAAAERCAQVVQAFKSAAECPIESWDNSIEPWDQVVQPGVNEFGDRKRFVELANIAAGVRSKEEKCEDSRDLFDSDQPLVRRARYARLRAGSRNWWSTQLQSATKPNEIWMALLLFFTWSGATTFEKLADKVDKLVANLGTAEWHSLYSSLRTAIEISSDSPRIKKLAIRVNELPSSLSIRTVALLAERCTKGTAGKLYERYLAEYVGDDAIVLSLRADIEVRHALRDNSKWPQAIESLRSSYSNGEPITRPLFQHLRHGSSTALPDHVARCIVDQPLEFPATLVRVAESRCRQLDASKILPVGQVAADEGWFVD